MFTSVGGEWDEIMPVIPASIDKVADRVPPRDGHHPAGLAAGQPADRLSRDVELVERGLR